MRYIKLFENHSYYWEITPLEYYDLSQPPDMEGTDPRELSYIRNFFKENMSNFNEEEISRIEKFFPQWLDKSNIYYINQFNLETLDYYKKYGDCQGGASQLFFNIPTYSDLTRRFTCIIIKLKDEWYLCHMGASNTALNKSKIKPKEHTLYFKCDQFDGLLKCLEDNVQKVLLT